MHRGCEVLVMEFKPFLLFFTAFTCFLVQKLKKIIIPKHFAEQASLPESVIDTKYP